MGYCGSFATCFIYLFLDKGKIEDLFMFTDIIKMRLSAGKGGDGTIAWRREKYIPKGALVEEMEEKEDRLLSRAIPRFSLLKDIEIIALLLEKMEVEENQIISKGAMARI